jgi:Fe2+ or Zn2+ uptake regulation protein
MPQTDPPNDVQLRTALESEGWRCTPQRLEVYRFLRARVDSHPSAVEVFNGVRRIMPSISLATVYKALEALEAAGLVAKVAAADAGSARYDARAERHYHVRCLRSGRVEDVNAPYDAELLDKLDPGLRTGLKERGFQLTGYRLELVGYFEDEATPVDSPDVTDR